MPMSAKSLAELAVRLEEIEGVHLAGVLLGHDASPPPVRSPPPGICVCTPRVALTLTLTLPLPPSSIKEKLMTQADRFSEDEVSVGFPGHCLESSGGGPAQPRPFSAAPPCKVALL